MAEPSRGVATITDKGFKEMPETFRKAMHCISRVEPGANRGQAKSLSWAKPQGRPSDLPAHKKTR